MTSAVVVADFVSPFGTSAAEHVHFLLAELPTPPASPATDVDGKSLPLLAAPFLESGLPVRERAISLTALALARALQGGATDGLGSVASIMLVTSAARPGWGDADAVGVETYLASRLKGPTRRFRGAAGAFAALKAGGELLATSPGSVVWVVAVDTHASVAFLEDRLDHPRGPWASGRPDPSEAAAVVCLTSSTSLAALGRRPIAVVKQSAIAMGDSNDDNDEPVDPTAMTAVLRKLGDDPISLAYGQADVDLLRQREWYGALARNHWRARGPLVDRCIESDIGEVGAASGLTSMVFGFHEIRAGYFGDSAAARVPMIAWAISRDGTRGGASLDVEAR